MGRGKTKEEESKRITCEVQRRLHRAEGEYGMSLVNVTAPEPADVLICLSAYCKRKKIENWGDRE